VGTNITAEHTAPYLQGMHYVFYFEMMVNLPAKTTTFYFLSLYSIALNVIRFNTQGVPGGMCQTSGEYSLS